MIIRKVLIVDDELENPSNLGSPDAPRDATYLKVIEELNLLSPDSFIYEPLFCGSEEQVYEELRSSTHSKGELLSIVDLVLDEGDRFSESGANDLLDKILEKCRLAFFTTRRLEDAKISSLIKFQRANRSAGLFPFELLQEQPREFARLVHRGLETYDEGKAIDYIEFLHNRQLTEINILLLSDFHFTDSNLLTAQTDLENTFDAVSDVIDDRRLDMAFLLGDFSDRGCAAGFDTAHEFVSNIALLANFDSLPSDFLYLVPGNHDVVLPLSLSAHVQKSDGRYSIVEDSPNPDLQKYGIQPYHHFRNKIGKGVVYFGEGAQDPILSKKHWIDVRWASFGFLIVGLDSNSSPNLSRPITGELTAGELRAFRNTLNQIPKDQRSRLTLLLLAHHYSGDGGNERGIDQYEELRKHCSELEFKGIVFINGDRHGDANPQLGRQLINDGTTPLEIAVPTFCQKNTARQEGASRGSILLNLGSENGELKNVTVQSFNFKEGSIISSPNVREYKLDHNGFGRK